jgi:hypothetical protein
VSFSVVQSQRKRSVRPGRSSVQIEHICRRLAGNAKPPLATIKSDSVYNGVSSGVQRRPQFRPRRHRTLRGWPRGPKFSRTSPRLPTNTRLDSHTLHARWIAHRVTRDPERIQVGRDPPVLRIGFCGSPSRSSTARTCPLRNARRPSRCLSNLRVSARTTASRRMPRATSRRFSA